MTLEVALDGEWSPARLLIDQLPRARAHLQRAPLASPSLIDGGTAAAGELGEASLYRYRLDVPFEPVHVEPTEVFEPDDDTGLTGRLRTGEFVGEIEVIVSSANVRQSDLRARLSVKPRKFADVEAYHDMLSDLAFETAEALHSSFAPSAGSVSLESSEGPRLLYQRFAVLNARLFAPEVSSALDRICASPYETWEPIDVPRLPGQSLGGGSATARSLVWGVPRAKLPQPRRRLTSVPVRIPSPRSEATFDNPPNRWLAFVLSQWMRLADDTEVAVLRSLTKSRLHRARREVDRVRVRLEELQQAPFLRDVGRLSAVPAANQVIQKRDGYRQVFATAVLVESGARLDVQGGETVVISRRNVAELYEWWCFVRVARALAEACGTELPTGLFEADRSGLALRLRRGVKSGLRFSVSVDGVNLQAELFFNRPASFGQRSGQSWTAAMRPDVSVRIWSGDGDFELGAEHWVHFDAKYRLKRIPDVRGAIVDDEEPEPAAEHRADDLLKMHAYRDAIRGSAAAYVLFPGSVPSNLPLAADERLPAIGAIPLRPELVDVDAPALKELFRGILTHAANEATRHRRAEYWSRTAYRGPSGSRGAPTRSGPWRPPADTTVLVGWVRNERHRDWILGAQQYNVRADRRRGAVALDAPLLGAELLVLWNTAPWWAGAPLVFERTGAWTLMTADELAATGYPEPSGQLYLCCGLRVLDYQPGWMAGALESAWGGRASRAPFGVSWAELAAIRADS